MYIQHAKVSIIPVLLLLSWLVTACGGSKILCVETQGKAEIEYGWMNECGVPSVPGAVDRSILTCDQCKHYPLKPYEFNHNHGSTVRFVDYIASIPPFHSVVTGYFGIAYQPVLFKSTDVLRTVVLTI
jgi:hypothetical protein